MKRVLVVCPQERDFREIAAAGLEHDFRVLTAGSDLDAADDSFDPEAFVARHALDEVDGVVGTKDRSALLATLVAARSGLPGPTPHALLACQHKPTSRRLQQQVAPEAVPRFGVYRNDGGPVPLEPPFFVKPVVGRLSENARRIDSLDQLADLGDDGYPPRYARIAALAGIDAESIHGFLVEEIASGREVTFEGYVFDGRVTPIGFTDSLKYPGSNSFEAFAFPGAVSAERDAEIERIAGRVLSALGFDGGFFNMEFFVPEGRPATLIEVNGRIASQFAPLVRAVHGRSTYEAMFRLACGEDPDWRADRGRGVALSYCLRVFEDAFVARVPEPEAGLEVLVRPGRRLSEQGTNDAESYRLAIFTQSGATVEEALEACRARAAELPFELEPAAPVGSGAADHA